MCLRQQNLFIFLCFAGLLFCHKVYAAVVFEPGVGIGIESTDNATLSHDDPVDDLIFGSYVGARIADDQGSLIYDAAASFNKHNYTQDSFGDQRYFNLGLSSDWEMIRDRFHWFVTDSFVQTKVVSLGSNTPNNIQDSNVFTFGANIDYPFSARQSFSLVPMFTQYYYEVQSTDNKQMRTTEQNSSATYIQGRIDDCNGASFSVYRDLITKGCPRELARSVLPVGTYSHMFATANLHNWFRFLGERLHPHAQYEIRVYAEALLGILESIAPVAVAAFRRGLN